MIAPVRSAGWVPTTPQFVRPATSWSRPLARLAAIAAATAALAALFARLEPVVVLGAALAGLGVVAVMAKPEWAVLAFVFLLYSNIPAVASQAHGVPRAIAAAFPLLLVFPLVQQVVIRHRPIRQDPVLALMIALLGVFLLSSLGARGHEIAMARTRTYAVEGIGIYWLLTNSVHTPRLLRRTVWAVLAAASLLGGLTLFQAVTGSYQQQFGGLARREMQFEIERAQSGTVLQKAEGEMVRADRAEGPMLETNRYAQVMIVLLPLALFSFRRARRGRGRLLAAAAGGLVLAGMLLTYSRGALLTLTLLVLFAGWVGWIRRSHVVSGMIAGAVVLALAAPAIYNRLLSVGSATDLLSSDGSAAEADGAIRGRATEMLAALKVFTDHPLLGVGPGQYAPFYSVEYQLSLESRFRDIQQTRRAHSLYIETGAELGVVGLIVFLSIPGLLIRSLWRERRRWPPGTGQHEIATALVFSMLAYLGTATFLHLSFERYYWFLIALSSIALQLVRAGTPPRRRRRAAEPGPRLTAPRGRGRPAFRPAVAGRPGVAGWRI